MDKYMNDIGKLHNALISYPDEFEITIVCKIHVTNKNGTHHGTGFFYNIKNDNMDDIYIVTNKHCIYEKFECKIKPNKITIDYHEFVCQTYNLVEKKYTYNLKNNVELGINNIFCHSHDDLCMLKFTQNNMNISFLSKDNILKDIGSFYKYMSCDAYPNIFMYTHYIDINKYDEKKYSMTSNYAYKRTGNLMTNILEITDDCERIMGNLNTIGSHSGSPVFINNSHNNSNFSNDSLLFLGINTGENINYTSIYKRDKNGMYKDTDYYYKERTKTSGILNGNLILDIEKTILGKITENNNNDIYEESQSDVQIEDDMF
jgi:hypothetical protein